MKGTVNGRWVRQRKRERERAIKRKRGGDRSEMKIKGPRAGKRRWRNPADYEEIGFSGINLGTRATNTYYTCTSSHGMSYLFFLYGAYRIFRVKGLVDVLKKRSWRPKKIYCKKSRLSYFGRVNISRKSRRISRMIQNKRLSVNILNIIFLSEFWDCSFCRILSGI